MALVMVVALSRPLHDFLEYWTMAHLFIEGRNCYSLIEVFRREVALGWTEPAPLIALNPPWLLPLLAPLGLFHSYPLAWLAWNAVLVGSLLLSSFVLLGLYAPDVRLPEISDTVLVRSLFIFSFYPAMLVLRYAQTAPLVLLGSTGFLWFIKRDRPILAGSALAVAAIKPHLLYLVFVAVVAQAIKQRSGKLIIGLAWPLIVLTGIAALRDPHVLRHYLELSGGPYAQLYPSAVGAVLRLPFGTQNTFFLQFLPSVAGLVWFSYWHRHQRNWIWLENMPTLLTVSILTTWHGWLFDQLLLAIPLVALFACYARRFGRIPAKLLLLYTAVNAAVIVGGIFQNISPAQLAYLVAPVVVCIALSWPRFRRKVFFDVHPAVAMGLRAPDVPSGYRF